jgi:CheY-like chemotaxis protein
MAKINGMCWSGGAGRVTPLEWKMQKRVLVVDDSELQRMIMRDALVHLHCQVVGEAESGAEAVEKVAQLRPDVVLLDMEMPGITGLGALKAIKASRPEVVVIMVTSIDSADVIDDCLMAGAEDYIRKDRLDSLEERMGGYLKG